MLLVVGLCPVVVEEVPHQDMNQPISSPPSQPGLALGQAALEAPMIALDGSIGILIGMWNVAEGHNPTGCNQQTILQHV